ncbi:MAG: efflux RND transporter periplasmic adaptor subunit [Spirochaetota bacterium]
MKNALKVFLIVFIILGVLAGLGWVAYYRYEEKINIGKIIGKKPDQSIEVSTPVAVTRAEVGSMTESLILNGEVAPVTEVSVYSSIPGKVKNITVQEADRVEKDQVLAYVERTEAGLEFKPSPVESSINGIVKSTLVEEGASITPQTPLLQLINMDSVNVVVHVPEKDIYRVKPGLKVEMRVVSSPDRVFEGRVTRQSPVVDPASRTRRAKIRIRNYHHTLKPGMFGEAEVIIRKEPRAVIIPLSAILERDGRSVVFVAEEGRAVQKEIKLDIREGEKVSILEGVKEGDMVIVIGQHNVSDGDRVNVTEEIE